jgi:hypothetical protein
VTPTAARRQRLLRLRTIEHSTAAARFMVADAAHAALADVVARLAQLRTDLTMAVGVHHGHDVQGLAELSMRLDRARDGLTSSLSAAAQTRRVADDQRLTAQSTHDRVGRVHAEATRREAADRALRIAASYPPRRGARALP